MSTRSCKAIYSVPTDSACDLSKLGNYEVSRAVEYFPRAAIIDFPASIKSAHQSISCLIAAYEAEDAVLLVTYCVRRVMHAD